MILHFPSLHAGAAPHGGIFTQADMVPLLFMSCCLFFLSYVSRQAASLRFEKWSIGAGARDCISHIVALDYIENY